MSEYWIQEIEDEMATKKMKLTPMQEIEQMVSELEIRRKVSPADFHSNPGKGIYADGHQAAQKLLSSTKGWAQRLENIL